MNRSIQQIYTEANELKGMFKRSTTSTVSSQSKYKRIRNFFIDNEKYSTLLPDIVHKYPEIKEFNRFIKKEFKSPQERLDFVERQFASFINYIENELNQQKEQIDVQQKRKQKEQFEEITEAENGSLADDLMGGDLQEPETEIEPEETEQEELGKEIKSEKIKPVSGKRKGFSIEEDIDGVIGVKDLAAEIATLLHNLKIKEKGKMIGIFGKWGRGKTFLMDQIWERLKQLEVKKFYRVKFHAWKYQDTPASWAYLYESFANRYYKSDEIFWLFKPVYIFIRRWRLNLKRYGYLPIIGLLLPILMFILGYYGVIADLKIIIEKTSAVFFGISGLGIITLIYKLYIEFNSKATDLFKKYMHKHSFHELLGVQAEIQNELNKLLQTWISKREVENKGSAVLLVVDDIDRCQETRLIQIIDSLRVMLEDDEISKRVVVLAAIDGNVLKRAIKWKYYDLIETDYELHGKLDDKINVSKELIKEYMDKLFLAGIRLGVLTAEERLDIFEAFSMGKIAPVKEEKEQTEEADVEAPESDKPDHAGQIDVEGLGKLNQAILKQNEDIIDYFVSVPTYDLEPAEAQELNDLIKRLEDATPRQIRIFYYRYLLARNLLDRQIQKLNLESTGKREGEMSLMGELLLQYTLSSETMALREIKKQIAASESEEFTITLNGADYTDNRKLLYSIYNVLEMVIAY